MKDSQIGAEAPLSGLMEAPTAAHFQMAPVVPFTTSTLQSHQHSKSVATNLSPESIAILGSQHYQVIAASNMLSWTTIARASSLVLALPCLISAQSTTNDNLTLTFYPDSESTCGNNGISFTTGVSEPYTNLCFNLADVFGGNQTNGMRNASSSSVPPLPGVFEWTVLDKEAYDPAANYSHIRYQQPQKSTTNNSDHHLEAYRSVTLYNGKQCLQEPEAGGGPVLPWYGLNCISDDGGDCHTLPYNLQSFGVETAVYAQAEDCWKLSKQGQDEEGAASIRFARSTASLVIVASVAVAIQSLM
ncbi:Uu.00g051560.m01.CDS01 [Anthostomella pinea]|uniref:Uu.00g051560.m01.CDS01 n=1 Tax=Anthostomella pinea TaxID=933095 RepID=A0AAI8VTN6_9PEZI|nr:Uu.00g051560.m01.CDS01 [Anthostomella pinea]